MFVIGRKKATFVLAGVCDRPAEYRMPALCPRANRLPADARHNRAFRGTPHGEEFGSLSGIAISVTRTFAPFQRRGFEIPQIVGYRIDAVAQVAISQVAPHRVKARFCTLHS